MLALFLITALAAPAPKQTWGVISAIDRQVDGAAVTLLTQSGPRTLIVPSLGAQIFDLQGQPASAHILRRGDAVRAEFDATAPGAEDEVDRATRIDELVAMP